MPPSERVTTPLRVVDVDSMLDTESVLRRLAAGREAFATARPFRHIVLDDVLREPKRLVLDFPSDDWDGWSGLGDSYQTAKRSCDVIEALPYRFRQLIAECSTPGFLAALEELTGIEKLIPDPHLIGGGLHLSTEGGVLAPHSDFHLHERLGLYRRVNLIIYLNDGWTERDGGCLQLFAARDPVNAVKTVAPTLGRLVAFQTDDVSVHGFPVPVGPGLRRRSVALYYYTAAEAVQFSGDATTHWRTHGTRGGTVRRARLASFRLLIQISRAFSLLAHLVNPNQGVSWWRTRQERLRHKV